MYEIDLHGYKHKDALIKVEEYLLLNSVHKIIDVKIITGNSSELQKKLIKLFKKYDSAKEDINQAKENKKKNNE